jgi:hypothetical protein
MRYKNKLSKIGVGDCFVGERLVVTCRRFKPHPPRPKAGIAQGQRF